ncbi:LacI family DNA-binding transcriptional regulator [Demequina sp. NBRC 110056]|uniref:LacI family DNA-binding transcriptional regulator n=1 Tax=Demequina sp. NBRC 110056 TaxID=1570345 RepID=UPI000A0704FF|nr:LacI family DNA-binding transcriptional regulator [Demequina sp. NBRC 110056]
MAATMADVARVAGVSKKTVSNYFNGYPYFKPETRARIEAAIDELGYQMNRAARSLRSGKTGRICLALPELAQPYFAQLAEAVVATAQRTGYEVIVEVTGGDRDHELEVLGGARTLDVDGMIFGSLSMRHDDVDADGLQVPLVFVGDRGVSERFDFVAVDSEEGVREATRYLLDQGRTRVVALGWEDSGDATSAAVRTRGYIRAHEESGVTIDPALCVGSPDWGMAGGDRALSALLETGATFDAVAGFNDAMALGALTALRRAGLAVPDDVAVVGFDNILQAEYSAPALTTVDAGLTWVAERAVATLLQRLVPGDGSETAIEVAPSRLVVRESA